MPFSSVRKATPTSSMEMAEVMAAARMATKNTMEMMALTMGREPAIRLKIKGRVSKTRPGPVPGSIPAEKTAGMMAKPAMTAKSRSAAAVPKPDTIRFSSFFT